MSICSNLKKVGIYFEVFWSGMISQDSYLHRLQGPVRCRPQQCPQTLRFHGHQKRLPLSEKISSVKTFTLTLLIVVLFFFIVTLNCLSVSASFDKTQFDQLLSLKVHDMEKNQILWVALNNYSKALKVLSKENRTIFVDLSVH